MTRGRTQGWACPQRGRFRPFPLAQPPPWPGVWGKLNDKQFPGPLCNVPCTPSLHCPGSASFLAISSSPSGMPRRARLPCWAFWKIPIKTPTRRGRGCNPRVTGLRGARYALFLGACGSAPSQGRRPVLLPALPSTHGHATVQTSAGWIQAEETLCLLNFPMAESHSSERFSKKFFVHLKMILNLSELRPVCFLYGY